MFKNLATQAEDLGYIIRVDSTAPEAPVYYLGTAGEPWTYGTLCLRALQRKLKALRLEHLDHMEATS